MLQTTLPGPALELEMRALSLIVDAELRFSITIVAKAASGRCLLRKRTAADRISATLPRLYSLLLEIF
jgi:hypothetical protein